MEIRRFEERMENLREELRKERDKSQKKTTKDLVEVYTSLSFSIVLDRFFILLSYTLATVDFLIIPISTILTGFDKNGYLGLVVQSIICLTKR